MLELFSVGSTMQGNSELSLDLSCLYHIALLADGHWCKMVKCCVDDGVR